MKKIYAYWWKLGSKIDNFGDALTPYMIKRLSGKDVIYSPPLCFNLAAFKRIIGLLLGKKIKLLDFLKQLFFFRRKTILAVGSIISAACGRYCYVWGSGVIKKDEMISRASFCAVRGRLTQERLRELGHEAPNVIGDPALLLPLLYVPNVKKKYRIGIIPHYIHYRQCKNFDSDDILVIDLTGSVENVIDEINSCCMTFSSSLHGIIVSQAYDIPSAWARLSDDPLEGDNIKFYDYFSSVDINPYIPIKIEKISDAVEWMERNEKKTRINKNISLIQFNLIKAAPFDVKDEVTSAIQSLAQLRT